MLITYPVIRLNFCFHCHLGVQCELDALKRELAIRNWMEHPESSETLQIRSVNIRLSFSLQSSRDANGQLLNFASGDWLDY